MEHVAILRPYDGGINTTLWRNLHHLSPKILLHQCRCRAARRGSVVVSGRLPDSPPCGRITTSASIWSTRARCPDGYLTAKPLTLGHQPRRHHDHASPLRPDDGRASEGPRRASHCQHASSPRPARYWRAPSRRTARLRLRWRASGCGYCALEDQAFDLERHDREGFRCGVPRLDKYLQWFAVRHRRRARAVHRGGG